MKSIDHQKGIGLIEALIAAIVFAVGIAALVKLQGSFFQNSSSANARSIAMSIAQEKLEDLRGFQVTDSSDTSIFDFTSISSGSGGQICTLPTNDNNGDGSINKMDIANPPDIDKNGDGVLNGNDCVNLGVDLLRPSVAVNATTKIIKNNISFSRVWSVTNYYYNGTTLTTTPNGDVVQKLVTINVNWTDTDGKPQTTSLSTVINSTSTAAATGVIGNYIGGSGESPVIPYTASSDTDVVAVGVGSNNTKRETLVPTTNSSGQVKFTAYTYNSSGTLLRQEDFLTVSCNCAFTTSGQARTASFAKWDTSTDTYKDQEGDLIDKDKGCVTNGKNSNCVNNADELCTSCCSDHHDPGASSIDSTSVKYCDPANGVLNRCFDPFRDSSDYSSGKHNHYTSSGVLANTGQYLESCRMKRINGFWRVYQDWHRVDLSAFPLSELASSTSEGTYSTYVQNIINAVLDDTSITPNFNGQSFSLPTKPTLANRTSSNPISLAIAGQETLTARAVYVDYLSSSLLTPIRAKKTAGSDYLIHVPFYEVDITNRAPKCAMITSTAYGGWCPPGTHEVDVGAGDISDNNGNGLAAGVIKGVSSTSSPVNVSFTMRRSNSGLMGLSEPVDVSGTTNSDILRDAALVAVSVTGSGSTTHTLSVTLTGGSPTSGSLSVTPSSGTGSCTGSGTSYSCTVPNSISGSLSFSGTAGADNCTGSGSYSGSSSNQSVTLAISCAPVDTTHTFTVTLNPTGGTPLTGTLTSDLATNCAGSGTSYTCTESNTASGTANWTYSGTTSSGSSCSGSGTYTASGITHSETLNVICVSTRTLNVCLTKDNFNSGTLIATPTGESQISCSTPSGPCGSGANVGTSSTCSVTSGVGGSLSFSGTASGNKICGIKTGATSSYGVNDTTFNLEIACQ